LVKAAEPNDDHEAHLVHGCERNPTRPKPSSKPAATGWSDKIAEKKGKQFLERQTRHVNMQQHILALRANADVADGDTHVSPNTAKPKKIHSDDIDKRFEGESHSFRRAKERHAAMLKWLDGVQDINWADKDVPHFFAQIHKMGKANGDTRTVKRDLKHRANQFMEWRERQHEDRLLTLECERYLRTREINKHLAAKLKSVSIDEGNTLAVSSFVHTIMLRDLPMGAMAETNKRLVQEAEGRFLFVNKDVVVRTYKTPEASTHYFRQEGKNHVVVFPVERQSPYEHLEYETSDTRNVAKRPHHRHTDVRKKKTQAADRRRQKEDLSQFHKTHFPNMSLTEFRRVSLSDRMRQMPDDSVAIPQRYYALWKQTHPSDKREAKDLTPIKTLAWKTDTVFQTLLQSPAEEECARMLLGVALTMVSSTFAPLIWMIIVLFNLLLTTYEVAQRRENLHDAVYRFIKHASLQACACYLADTPSFMMLIPLVVHIVHNAFCLASGVPSKACARRTKRDELRDQRAKQAADRKAEQDAADERRRLEKEDAEKKKEEEEKERKDKMRAEVLSLVDKDEEKARLNEAIDNASKIKLQSDRIETNLLRQLAIATNGQNVEPNWSGDKHCPESQFANNWNVTRLFTNNSHRRALTVVQQGWFMNYPVEYTGFSSKIERVTKNYLCHAPDAVQEVVKGLRPNYQAHARLVLLPDNSGCPNATRQILWPEGEHVLFDDDIDLSLVTHLKRCLATSKTEDAIALYYESRLGTSLANHAQNSPLAVNSLEYMKCLNTIEKAMGTGNARRVVSTSLVICLMISMLILTTLITVYSSRSGKELLTSIKHR